MIDSEKFYSAAAVFKMGILPWSSLMTFIRKLEKEPWNEIFNPIIEKGKYRRSFRIQGKDVLKFIKLKKENNAKIYSLGKKKSIRNKV